MLRTALLVCGLLLGNWAFAQHDYRVGWLPQLNFNFPMVDQWRLNAGIESRPLVRTGTFATETDDDWQYSLTDVSIVLARKLGANATFSGGWLLRMNRASVEIRLLQQFSTVREYTALRLGQRFAADQTFAAGADMVLRLRYRLGLELPLNGQRVDPGETYLKLNNEYLNVFQSGNYDLEIRLEPTLGYVINDNSKLETGLSYRLDSFLNDGGRSTFWWELGWYRSW